VTDERVERYARLLVETCVDVQPGWEVLVLGSPHGRPLLEELGRALARRGAYAVYQLSFTGTIPAADRAWLREASAELVAKPAALQVHLLEKCDAIVLVDAPENTRDASSVDHERLAAAQLAYRPAIQRLLSDELPWVGCQYPTPALAQDAGMGTDEFADFLFGACLLDWNAERERMQRYADRFDAADEVRIVGERTDLTLSVAGRKMEVDAGGGNMPGGEFFGCPVENSADGEIVFGEFPAVYAGRELNGVRLRFESGRVVDASADTNEEFLLQTLDQDEGARRLGELGIGCNPGITRYMKNTLFDEKIDGTVHLALGNGFPKLGGNNGSALHWDIVKDLRNGGRILLDGEVVQENGRWSI
jgi:aminopeptidase